MWFKIGRLKFVCRGLTVNKGLDEADGQIDPDHHTASEYDGKLMLTVPCFTACHYFEGEGDYILGRGVKNNFLFIQSDICCKRSIQEKRTCLFWTLKG